MIRHIAAIALATTLAMPAIAENGAVTYETDDSFEDAIFALENAILDKGLVIDSVSHTGEMLERTKADVGGTVTLFEKADVYSFCSAALSRKVMEADPMNIRFCPYDIFVMQQPGAKVTVGFRTFPEGPMQEVQALLDGIARSAAGLE
ncbi:MAG: DUF302 domain-containing protein [Rhodobacteraceae bacterium]|jgi:uncharacterized protein (DUF302 family)|nr:DUF302 domain-containing protein [Paracoccaceae bacterium]